MASLELLKTFVAAAHVLLIDRLLFNTSCVGKVLEEGNEGVKKWQQQRK
jgi:hypothetical protein